MTIVATHLLNGSDTTNTQVTYSTASVTPVTDGSPVVICIAFTRATGSTAPGLTSVTGMNLTWANITAGTNKDAGSSAIKTAIAYGVGTAANGVLTITPTANTATGCAWVVFQLAGAHLTTPYSTVNGIQSTSTSAATSMSLTLPSTPTAGNAVVGTVAWLAAAETIGAGTNFTRGTAATMSTPSLSLNWEYKTVLDTTVDCTWTSNVGYNGVGFEITAAPGGSPVGFIPI